MKKVNKKYKHLETRPNTVFIVLIENSSESFHCIHFPGGAKEKQRLFFPSGFCPIHLKDHQYVMMHQFSTEYQEIFSKHIFFHISCLSLRSCLNLTATCTWNCEEVQGRCTCGKMTDPLASRLGNLEGLWCHWRRPLPSSSQGRPWVKNMICHQDPESWILGFEDLGFRILKSFWYLSPEITLRPNLAILAGALRGHLAELARRLVAVGLASLPCKVARLARLALASLPCKVGAGCRLRWWGDGLTLERDRWKADGKDPWRENFPTFHTVFWWNQLKPIDFCTEINLPLIRLYHWQIVHALHGKYFSIVWRFEVHAHVVEEDIVYTL